MDAALDLGTFVRDRECFSFVSGLDEAAAQIGNFGRDARRAVALYETFLAGGGAKTGERDDPSVVRPIY